MTLRERISAPSRWWLAMVITTFATGGMFIYFDNGHKAVGGYGAVGLLLSMLFTRLAAFAHFKRNREDSRTNTVPALILAAMLIIGAVFAFVLQTPLPLKAIMVGASTTAVALVIKNYWVSDYLYHYQRPNN